MNPPQGANSPTPNQLPRLLRQDITRWANVHGIYPADAAKQAFEDAATSDYAKAFAHAEHAQLVARVASLEGALRHEAQEAREEAAFYFNIQNRGRQNECLKRARRCNAALLSPVPQEGQKPLGNTERG